MGNVEIEGFKTSNEQHTIVYALHGNAYINLTNRCTLRCKFCPKFNKQWEVQGYPLRLTEEPDVNEVLIALGDVSQYQEIVFCGLGEPTLRLGNLLEIAELLKKRGARVRLNTDGLANLVHGYDVTLQFAGKIDSLSISLNAQHEEVYNLHCRPQQENAYPAMLDFITRAHKHVADITLTAIDGLAGVDIDACAHLAQQLNVAFRRRVLDQVG